MARIEVTLSKHGLRGGGIVDAMHTRNITLNAAFSLVELLIVMAIIAILAGMLLPAVGLVRSTVRSVVCQSNMHQISIGISSYADEHRGRLPWTLNYFGGGGWDDQSWGENWGQTIAVYMEVRLGDYPHGNMLEGANFTGPRSRLGVFNCPENQKQTWQMATGGGEEYTSYTGNGKGDYSQPFEAPWSARYFSAKIQQLGHKGELMAFWDGSYYASDPQQSDGGGTLPYRGVGAGGVRYAHRGKANIMYADGHIGGSQLIMDCGSTTAVPISEPMRAASWSNGRPWWGAD